MKRSSIKTIVDISMTVLLLCLMAYQVTGEALHEWIGIAMTIVLISHHVLNIKWYTTLFKGRYNSYRFISTAVNALLLISIVITAVCGMSMSNHAVPFLYGMLNMIFSRTMHLGMSYWSFILMGIHLGFHFPVIIAKFRFQKKLQTIIMAVSVIFAGIGLCLFIRNGILDYILFRTHFAYFDYEKAGIVVFSENLIELLFFCFVGANTVYFLQNQKTKDRKKSPPSFES